MDSLVRVGLSISLALAVSCSPASDCSSRMSHQLVTVWATTDPVNDCIAGQANDVHDTRTDGKPMIKGAKVRSILHITLVEMHHGRSFLPCDVFARQVLGGISLSSAYSSSGGSVSGVLCFVFLQFLARNPLLQPLTFQGYLMPSPLVVTGSEKHVFQIKPEDAKPDDLQQQEIRAISGVTGVEHE